MLTPAQIAIIDRMRWLVEHGWPRRTIESLVTEGGR